jgi:thiamine-phosphate pyrophosphorylase
VNERAQIGRLHVITDVAVQTRFDHVRLAELACAGGADTIQFRDKTLASSAFIDIARRIRVVCARYGVTFIVNDRVEEARAAGADGVHVGRDDATIAEARAALGSHAVIGTSANSPESARIAERDGADYIGVGHVFATASKKKPGSPIGVETLAAVCRAVAIPVIAIGGVTVETAPDIVRAGAHGIAVIGAVCGASDPEAATRRLVAAIAAAA